MKATIGKAALVQALKAAAKVSPWFHAAMQVLSCLRLAVTDDGLVVEATDLDVTLRLPVEAEGLESGQVLVNTHRLLGIVSKMPAGAVALAVIDSHVVVTGSTGSRVELVAHTGDELVATWPALPTMPGGPGMDLDGVVLSRLLSACAGCVSSDESRPNLNGVYFRAGGGVLRAVSTDGHRLAQAEAPWEGDDMDGIILPADGVARLLEHVGKSVTLRREHGSLAATLPGGGELFIRLIDAAFPDYRQVIPKGDGQRVTLDVAEMRDALALTGAVASERTHGVRLEFGDALTLASDAPDVGKAQAVIGFAGDVPASHGLAVQMAVNTRYLLDALAGLGSERVALHVIEPLAPLLVRPVDGDAVLYVIMPMRL